MVPYNPYIVIPLATWAVAQVVKFALAALRGRIDLRYMYASGGMPSAHSAVVTSLAVTALLQSGPSSAVFGITAVIAVIVMYDSLGVRRAAGEQAVALNMVLDALAQGKVKLDRPAARLREVLGHQPLEVFVGALFGLVLGGLFNYDKLGSLALWAQTPPIRGSQELWLYGVIFGLLVVAGWVQRLVLRRRFKKSLAIARVTQRVLVATQTIGWLGLVIVAFEYENASYLAWRLWAVLTIAAGLIWAAVLIMRPLRSLPSELKAEADRARKLKWFSFGRRRTKRA